MTSGPLKDWAADATQVKALKSTKATSQVRAHRELEKFSIAFGMVVFCPNYLLFQAPNRYTLLGQPAKSNGYGENEPTHPPKYLHFKTPRGA